MLFQRAIIFHPKKLRKDHVFRTSHPLTEYFFDFTIDNNAFQINAIHLKKTNPKGLVFFLHGTVNNIQYNIPKVEEYLINNFDVVIMDYPGYGKSKGKLTEKLLHEVVELTFQRTIKEIRHTGDIILVGRSLGTALASNLATKVNAHKLILISPYYNMPDLFRHHTKIFPFKKLKFRFENNAYLPEVKCDTYIFHGNEDKLIPIHLSQKLISHLKDPNNFVEIPDANHFNIHEHPLYKASIKNILS